MRKDLSVSIESVPDAAPSPDHDAEACAGAWFALRAAHARVAECVGAALSRECGLGISDFEVLLFLSGPGEASRPAARRVGQLGAAVSLSQSALSRLVGRLVARGLVARANGGDDHRAVLVSLTDAGREVLRRAMPLHRACVHEHVLRNLSDQDQATLLAILGRVR